MNEIALFEIQHSQSLASLRQLQMLALVDFDLLCFDQIQNRFRIRQVVLLQLEIAQSKQRGNRVLMERTI